MDRWAQDKKLMHETRKHDNVEMKNMASPFSSGDELSQILDDRLVEVEEAMP